MGLIHSPVMLNNCISSRAPRVQDLCRCIQSPVLFNRCIRVALCSRCIGVAFCSMKVKSTVARIVDCFLVGCCACVLMARRNRCKCCCACGCEKVPGCRRIVCSICQCYICPGVCLAIELDPIVRFAACRRCSRLSCTGAPSADAIRDLMVAWLCYCFASKWVVLSCVLEVLRFAGF